MAAAPIEQDFAFYQHIMASGPGLVSVVREDDLQIVFVNNFFEDEFGYSNEEVKGGNVYLTELIDPYQLDRLKHHILSVKGEYNKNTPYTIYKLKGRIKGEQSYYLFTSPIPDIDGIYGGLYKLIIQPDLSQWRLPFTSFETRELFLEHFQSEEFGTFEWLMAADKSFWSEGIYRIYDVDFDIDINKVFASSFIHPADKGWVDEKMNKVLAEGGGLDIEFRIISGKGLLKTIHSLGRIVKDKDGKPVKFIGSLRDVTKQRNIEDDLKNKVEKLHHSNKELEEFAYVASHDMQEPLRKITTFSSRLMEKYKDVLTGDGALYLSRMTVSAENMRMLINDLLEFSRISNAQQPFSMVDIGLIVKQVKMDLELVVEETNTEITVVGKLPQVEAIPSQMKQLFTNIISNAIKFRRVDVPPVITVKGSVADDEARLKYDLHKDETYYQIVITDNGIGFEEEYATRIFNVFQRLHGKSEYPGSGIGLAICKKILEHHNGIIYAEGVPGAGSKFIFIIPEHRKDIPLL